MGLTSLHESFKRPGVFSSCSQTSKSEILSLGRIWSPEESAAEVEGPSGQDLGVAPGTVSKEMETSVLQPQELNSA